MEPIPVSDPDDPRLLPYRDLRGADAAVRRHGFVVEGATALARALARGLYPLSSILVSERRRGALGAVLERPGRDVAVYAAPQAVMDEVCGFPVHRGVLGYGPGPVLPEAEALLEGIAGPAVVVCALGLTDVENMGSLFRNAAAFGARAVLADAACCDPLYRRAIRVSMGGALITPFARFAPGDDPLARLEAAGFEGLALSPKGATPLREFRPPARAALLVGAEGPGLPGPVLARARTVRIPMAEGFDSLNVAAAAAVALHHLAPGA